MSKEKLLIIEKNESGDKSFTLILRRRDYSVTSVSSFLDAEKELRKQPVEREKPLRPLRAACSLDDYFGLFIIVRPEIITENNPFVIDFVHRVREQYDWNAPVLLFTDCYRNYPMPITILARGPVECYFPNRNEDELAELIDKFFAIPAGLDKIKSIFLDAKKLLKENADKGEIEWILREMKIALTKQWQQDHTHPHSQYRQGFVLFDTAVRRLSAEKMTIEQLDVLLFVLEMLKKRPLSQAELKKSNRMCLRAGMNTLLGFTSEEVEQYLRGFYR